MAGWMSPGLGALGYVLNTMSDITSMVLTYYFGVFQGSQNPEKRRASKVLLYADGISVLYSWFFSWRQLRFMIPQIETTPLTGKAWEVELVAFLSAGFIPLTLAFVGYAQSLQVTEDIKPEIKKPAPKQEKTVNPGGLESLTPDPEKRERLQRLLTLYQENPKTPKTHIAKKLDVTPTTVYGYLNDLEAAKIIKRNGSGVIVLA
jgi:hypothetical protein